MVDVAKLAFDVDSRTIKTANDNLETMSGKADKAAKSSKKFENATKGGATGANKMSKAAQGTGTSLNFLKGLLIGFAATVLAAFSIAPVFAFQDAIAEVSTLVDTATFSMSKVNDESLKMAAQFGGSSAQQAGAFYQIISAGADNAADATNTLTAANKLAIGGVTDVRTAADGLTNTLNAYGDKVEGATAVSDALFIGMKAGKTTIGELSNSLGKATPLAAKLGVSFDELVASVSALTKGGIVTTEAVTGVRAILAAVAKPTSEATKLAKELGIEFNSTGLASKGLGGFLDELVTKTGGNTDQLALLFGGVEALIPIMALTGSAGKDFNKIMEQMAEKGGATEEAFNKIVNSPGFQAKRVWGALDAEINRLAGSISTNLVPAMKFLADNMETAIQAGTIILSTLIPGLVLGIGSLAVAIAGALGPVGLILSGLSAAVTAAIVFRKETATAAAGILFNFKQGIDGLIRMFDGFSVAMSFLWRDMANAAGSAAIGISNNFLAGIEGMINGAISLLNKLINQINRIPKVKIGNISDVSIGRKDDPFADNTSVGFSKVFDFAAKNSSGAGDFLNDTIKKLGEISHDTKKVTEDIKGLNEITELVTRTSAQWHLDEKMKKTVEGAKELRSTSKSSFQGFFADIKQGTSLLGALGNALNNIADKLLDMATNSLFESIFKPGSGGSSILSAFAGFFADGGNIPAGQFGIAGEAGPEVVSGPATVTPIGKLPKVANNNSGGDTYISVDARGSNDPAATEAAVKRGIAASVQLMESRMVSRSRPGFA